VELNVVLYEDVRRRGIGQANVDAQLLPQLPAQCLARAFLGPDVPSGKIPDVGIPGAIGSAVTQQHLVPGAKNRGRYSVHVVIRLSVIATD
jgi:hypothetical protein